VVTGDEGFGPNIITIFGIDPGVTTGWAFGRGIDVRTLPASECDIEWTCGQMSGTENQQARDLSRLIDMVWPCAVVIEDFVVRIMNQDRHFLSPVRVGTKVDYALWLVGRHCLYQQLSLAKTTIGDGHLKSVGAYQPGMPHANDAMRHCLCLGRRFIGNLSLYDELVAIGEL
jgi:hypothetical protein